MAKSKLQDDSQRVPAFWETCQPLDGSRVAGDLFTSFKSSEEVLSLTSHHECFQQSHMHLYTDGLATNSLVFPDSQFQCQDYGAHDSYAYAYASGSSSSDELSQAHPLPPGASSSAGATAFSDLEESDYTESEILLAAEPCEPPQRPPPARSDSFDLTQLLYSHSDAASRLPWSLVDGQKRNKSTNDVMSRRFSHGRVRRPSLAAPDAGKTLSEDARAVSKLKLQPRYTCTSCGKCFNRPSSLATHYNTHTGDKPFTCPFENCDKQFNARSNMTRHYKLHFKTELGTYLLPNGEMTRARPSMRQLVGTQSNVAASDLISFADTSEDLPLADP
ncbi:LAQU0S03e03268g1_1 [Lachancea quebecensis]|uniref:LAQU0S03e03268g1_1 n=1 Tax=Lachancea quebecensis TaxID=1654605 RepID=A0A0N7ML71_9SACH|nr:LAQU0S03e03268g1_1 [Lachancea quebecensis]